MVSDTHLSPRAPSADGNWDAVVAWVAEVAPDLVVHAGDISLDGANDEADLRHARRQLDRLSAPWMAVAGNHDIGDAPPAVGCVDAERRARYERTLGSTFWSMALGGWRLIGLDTQVMVSDEPDRERRWDWLAAELAAGGRSVVVQHRPLEPGGQGVVDAAHRYVPEPFRSRFAGVFAVNPPALVVSGHVHQRRTVTLGGSVHLWAPSTWATLPDGVQPRIGDKVVGVVHVDLDDDASITFHTPTGMAPGVVGVTFPSPYDH